MPVGEIERIFDTVRPSSSADGTNSAERITHDIRPKEQIADLGLDLGVGGSLTKGQVELTVGERWTLLAHWIFSIPGKAPGTA